MFKNIDQRIKNVANTIDKLESNLEKVNKHLETNPIDRQAMQSQHAISSNLYKLKSHLHILNLRKDAREFCDKIKPEAKQ